MKGFYKFNSYIVDNINYNKSQNHKKFYNILANNTPIDQSNGEVIMTAISDCWIAVSNTVPAVKIISIINILIFIAWYIFPVDFMKDHFMDSDINRKHNRWWSRILSKFSHYDILHITGNLSFLTLFGSTSVKLFGLVPFFLLTIFSGVVSSISTQIYFSCINQPYQSLGFSGIDSALAIIHAFYYPKESLTLGDNKILTEEFIETIICADIAGLANNYEYFTKRKGICSPVNHAAHLGGYFGGLLYIGLHTVISNVSTIIFNKLSICKSFIGLIRSNYYTFITGCTIGAITNILLRFVTLRQIFNFIGEVIKFIGYVILIIIGLIALAIDEMNKPENINRFNNLT